MSGGGKFRADAKLMQKPASATKPLQTLERVKGIEPSSQAWEARILPLNHTRLRCAPARQSRTQRRISIRCAALWQLVCVRSLRQLEPVNGLPQSVFNLPLPFR